MSQRGLVSFVARIAFALAVCAMLTHATGCVQRRMTIRSNPPGAMVYVDDYPIGTTPVSTDFIYYGTRKIRLVAPGYETLTVMQPMPAPWYQWFGIDFFTENLWPGEIRDERSFDFQMTAATQVPTEQLLGHAEQLRGASMAMAASDPQPVIAEQPPTVLPPTTVPPETVVPPGGVYPPAGTVPSGSVPSYGLPGGAPIMAPPPTVPPTYPSYELPPPGVPSNVPSSAPTYSLPPTSPSPSPGTFPSPQPMPPSVPPGWRPISQAPTPERY